MLRQSGTDDSRPSVTVDTVVLTVDPRLDSLQVVLRRRHAEGDDDDWELAGTFLRPRERLGDAAVRSLREKLGLMATSVEQLQVFDSSDLHGRWVLSVAHVVAVPWLLVESAATARPRSIRVRPVDRIGRLPFRQGEMVQRATEHLRRRYAVLPDPGNLLPEPFTLRQLHDIHQAVAPEPGPGERRPSLDTFRRYMLENGLVTRAGGRTQGTVGKPAALYRRAPREHAHLAFVGLRPLRPVRGKPQ